MSAPLELINLIRRSTVPVFVKTDNYVAAHISPSEPGAAIAGDWDEDRMRDYLYGEAMLNNTAGSGFYNGDPISIFVGDAKYHSWMRHYRVRKVMLDSLWTYEWELVK